MSRVVSQRRDHTVRIGNCKRLALRVVRAERRGVPQRIGGSQLRTMKELLQLRATDRQQLFEESAKGAIPIDEMNLEYPVTRLTPRIRLA